MAADDRWGLGHPYGDLVGVELSGTQRYWLMGQPVGGLDAAQIVGPIADVDPGVWLNDLGTAVDLWAHCADPNAGPAVYVESTGGVPDEAFEIVLGPLGDPVAGRITLLIRAQEIV